MRSKKKKKLGHNNQWTYNDVLIDATTEVGDDREQRTDNHRTVATNKPEVKVARNYI